MLTDELFRRILLQPVADAGADRLLIVSGYATANMADRHMEHLSSLNTPVDIELIVGMTPVSGIELTHHLGFRKMASACAYDDMSISCRYIANRTPVHAKVYCWLRNGRPFEAFIGSANYTMTGFGRSQVEVMESIDSQHALDFFGDVSRHSIDCLAQDVEDHVTLMESHRAEIQHRQARYQDTVTLSLLSRGDTPARSGLNWGQRPGRDRNQAYINIPVNIRNSGFFPDRAEQFTVLTDDGDSFIMVRAQDGGKALETTQSNALLGRYIRARMALGSGEYVTREDLVRYGRTDVSFTKIDEETYFLDFSPNMGPGEDAEIWEN